MADKASRGAKGVAKGGPSGLVISLLIHVGAFLLAGILVVFTVVNKDEKTFEPPKPVERPKMKLKKPKVKVKKDAKPQSTTRIVANIDKADMPDIQLPELSGIGDGLEAGAGLGDFNMVPDLEEMNIIGGVKSIGNDLQAQFYDLKRDRNGRSIPSGHESYTDALRRFISSGWKPSKLARFYRSPQKLYSTCVMLPGMPSYMGPRCFDEQTKGYHWAVHYTGELVYPEDVTFRFWGYGDNILVVALDGETVLNACRGDNKYIADWTSDTAEEGTFLLSGSDRYAFGGQWIELKAGGPKKLDIVIGEVYGGGFSAMLVVEVEGVDYPSRPGSSCPILPMFKTEEPSLDLLDSILLHMPEHEAALTNGPVFKDYVSKPREEIAVEPIDPEVEVATAEKVGGGMRIWTTRTGKEFTGKLITDMGDKLVFETPKEKMVKFRKVDMSDDDLKYVALTNPPEFDIDFIKTSKTVLNRYPLAPQSLDWGVASPQVSDYTFGARVKQARRAAVDYEHELTIEYFAVGMQKRKRGAYILLDRRSSSFTPSTENQMSHSFRGDPIEFLQVGGLSRKYMGYLVTITDSRGEIIQYQATKPWLWENLDNLKQMPVGRYMDKTCKRTFPTSAQRTY